MAAHGIELRDVDMFFDMIGFTKAHGAEHDEIPIERFVEGCMTMKGTATNFDVQRLTAHVDFIQKEMRQGWADISNVLRENLPGGRWRQSVWL